MWYFKYISYFTVGGRNLSLFKDFLKDSFLFTKKYYGYVFGIIALSFIFLLISFVILLIVGILLAFIMGIDMSTISLLNDVEVFRFLSSKFVLYLILMVIIFIIWIFLILVFIQYPLMKTFIEITRDRDANKSAFKIFFDTMKEKNFSIALKMIALGFLLALIFGAIFGIGILCIVFGIALKNLVGRILLLIVGVIGILLGIYILLRLMFANMILIDRDTGVVASIKESAKLTKGKVIFVLAVLIYNSLISAVFQIPVYIFDTMFNQNYQYNIFFTVLSLTGFIFYLVAIPYLIVLNYLPYNVLNVHSANIQNGSTKSDDYILG